MEPTAIAIALAHDGFGAVVLAFHKAIGNARRQKLEKAWLFIQSQVFFIIENIRSNISSAHLCHNVLLLGDL